MNKILNKTLILFFIFGITSCSSNPIFLEKDYDSEIKEVLPRGDKNINRIIESKLNFIKSSNENKKKRYTIEINSSKNREIVSKDSKGDPLKFELNILVEYKIMNNNDLLLNNKIENLGYFSLLAIAGSCFILGPMATFLIKGNINESISNKS